MLYIHENFEMEEKSFNQVIQELVTAYNNTATIPYGKVDKEQSFRQLHTSLTARNTPISVDEAQQLLTLKKEIASIEVLLAKNNEEFKNLAEVVYKSLKLIGLHLLLYRDTSDPKRTEEYRFQLRDDELFLNNGSIGKYENWSDAEYFH
jgi:hypothetical protein